MGNKNKVTRNLMEQVPGQGRACVEQYSSKANVTPSPGKIHRFRVSYRVRTPDGDAFAIVVSGRVRWALEELRKAGLRGCTPVDNPAPRWSAYIHELRGMGVEIETITEPHEGAFPGWHGRYVLRSGVTPDWKGGAQ